MHTRACTAHTRGVRGLLREELLNKLAWGNKLTGDQDPAHGASEEVPRCEPQDHGDGRC